MMTISTLFNRIFIKLLLGFWLCSSLIIAIVVLLPMLQHQFEKAPIPPHLTRMLSLSAVKIQQTFKKNPEKLLANWQYHIKSSNRHLRLFLTDENGQLVGNKKASRAIRHFSLIAEEAGHPISRQFRNKMIFGPHRFLINDKPFFLYGMLPDHHPRSIVLFLTDNKLLTLLLAIGLSGILCALLSWHLGKPLRILKDSANQLAKGKLNTRVNIASLNANDEIGQLANAFNAMANAVESMINNQQRLISDISHELRTPLTRLQLALALAKKKGTDSAELQRISYESEQLENLISELLELSRIKLNDNEPKLNLELSETLSQVLDDAEFEAEQKNKQLIIEIPDELAFLHNPKQLARAIENLLRNGIRYAQSQVIIRAQQSTENIEITIVDDGFGIDEKELGSIFEPFYRPQTARDRESGGWGLGLAITQAAIQANKGEISAQNISPGLKVTIKLKFSQ